MIDQNTRDRESWLKEVSIASFKENNFLLEDDIVLVAENNCFYKIVRSKTDVPLKNNLYAQIMPSEIVGNISTSNKLKQPFNFNLSGAVIGECSIDGSQNVNLETIIEGLDASKINTGVLNIDRIPDFDASKITTGTIDIARLPTAAMERLIEVPNDAARFALTKDEVNMGDVVKVTETLKMYKVIDTNNLNNEAGYSVFVAGSAAEVPWEGVIGKPSTMPNPYSLIIKLNGNQNVTYNRETQITKSF